MMCIQNSIAPIVINISAMLKIAKFMSLKSKKSVTNPWKNLSIKFPIAPPSINEREIHSTFL